VIDKIILRIAPEHMDRAAVILTLLRGEVVYRAE